jgi:radical SAM superfamily enzyme YgiQ (UPF0313 family)
MRTVPQKKLLLILPSNPRGFWGKVHRGRAGLIRLSLPTIAALTPADWDVKIIDSRIQEIDYSAKVDLVGLTAFIGEVPYAYSVADRFRERGIPVVIGGVHVSALPQEALEHADSVVIGEAEYVWKDLLSDLENKRLKPTYHSDQFCDMKSMVTPAYALMDVKMHGGGYALQATRGCPFNCDYCAVTGVFGRTFRMRPVGEVLSAIKSFPGRDFFFLDDNICGNPDYAKELFKAIVPLKKHWGGQTSITFSRDEELLRLYYTSGGRYALIGFETITQEGLAGVNKQWNKAAEYAGAIRKIHDVGINILGSFILGLDSDDISVFDRTLEFIMENSIDAAQFHILTPFPGTRFYDAMKAQNRITQTDWAKFTTCEVVCTPKKMLPQELQDGYHRIYRQTYSIPNILKRVFRRLDSGIVYRSAINFSLRNKARRMPK